MHADTTQRTWNAFHIYLPYTQQTGFLRDVIGPLPRTFERFFFLRYWQGGPHIRFRISGADPDTRDAVRATLAAAVPAPSAEITAEYDHEVSAQQELAQLEGEQPADIRQVGTVEPAQYRPEYAKYGGQAGIAIAERLFCATSVAVIDVLSGLAGRETTAPVGESMRITAMSLKGSGLDAEQSRTFLDRYETFWRRYVPAGADTRWPDLYQRASASVQKLCTSIWQHGSTDTVHDIYATALAEARTVSGVTQGELTGLPLGDTTYSACLANYIHTTNNRLGVIPSGEAFVAYLLRRALDDLITG